MVKYICDGCGKEEAGISWYIIKESVKMGIHSRSRSLGVGQRGSCTVKRVDGKNELQISEKAFQAQVIEFARRHSWRVAHFRPAMTQRGRWVTPVQADGAGFPDLVMVRKDRIIFAELKRQVAKLKEGSSQWDWWLALLSVGHEKENFDVEVWRPSDWPEIERVLK